MNSECVGVTVQTTTALVEISCDSLLSESCHRNLVKIRCLLAAYSAHTLPHATLTLGHSPHSLKQYCQTIILALSWHSPIMPSENYLCNIDILFKLFGLLILLPVKMCVDERDKQTICTFVWMPKHSLKKIINMTIDQAYV